MNQISTSVYEKNFKTILTFTAIFPWLQPMIMMFIFETKKYDSVVLSLWGLDESDVRRDVGYNPNSNVVNVTNGNKARVVTPRAVLKTFQIVCPRQVMYKVWQVHAIG